jgi:hypothetical protein
MVNKTESELNEILEALHYGQVVSFNYQGRYYGLESFKRDNDSFHSLSLCYTDKGETSGHIVFADKISYLGSNDYPVKFENNYPIREIKDILEREKVFGGKNLIDILEEIDDIDIQ